MRQVELMVVGGKQNGTLIKVRKKKFIIGRAEDCHLQSASESISRHHCVVMQDDYGTQLKDLGSTNGTFLNGEKIRGTVPLKPGDQISIGSMVFDVVIRESEPVSMDETVNTASDDSSGAIPTLPAEEEIRSTSETVELTEGVQLSEIEAKQPDSSQDPNEQS